MGGRLNLDGGGRSISMGERVSPRPPYNLSTGCNEVYNFCCVSFKTATLFDLRWCYLYIFLMVMGTTFIYRMYFNFLCEIDLRLIKSFIY